MDDLGCCLEGDHAIPAFAPSASEVYMMESGGYGDSAIKHITIDGHGRARCDTIPFPRVGGVPISPAAGYRAANGDLYLYGWSKDLGSLMFLRRTGQYGWELGEPFWGAELKNAEKYMLGPDGQGGVLLFPITTSVEMSSPRRVARDGRLLQRSERESLPKCLLSGGGVVAVLQEGALQFRLQQDSTLLAAQPVVGLLHGFDGDGRAYVLRMRESAPEDVCINRDGQVSEPASRHADPSWLSRIDAVVSPDGTLYYLDYHPRYFGIRRVKFEER
jgi:hypothetical protein